jgi:site-specific DNA-methyltransferase (adenine-specific)
MSKGSNSSNIRTEIIKGAWLNGNKMWGHPLNRICPRVGSMPPRLAHYLICKYSDPGDTIYDPFSGKATVPFQSCINGRKGIGNDISDEAYTITKALVNPPELSNFLQYTYKIKSKVERYFDDVSEEDLNDINLRTFYEEKTLRKILSIRQFLLEKPRNSRNDIFLKALMLGLLHGTSELHFSIPCSHSYSMSPRYVRNYIQKYNEENPTSSKFEYKEKDLWASIRKRARNILGTSLPESFVQGESLNRDAKKATRSLIRRDKLANLIVTSPPYFDAQSYAWDNWLRLWFLDKDYKEVKKKLFCTSSKETYLEKMKEFIDGFYDVLKEDSACFIIVGDVKRNGKVINTAEEIAKKILENGIEFKVEKIITDEIPKNRKTLTHVNGTNGVRYERILELHKGNVKKRDNPVRWN